MPQKKSAIKAHRQTQKRYAAHRVQLQKIKTLRKDALKKLETGKTDEAAELYRQFQKALDKAVKTNFIKKNAAARYKSRLRQKINAVGAKK